MSKSRTITADKLGEVRLAQMRRAPTHPGEIFRIEFREATSPTLSQAEAARRMGISTHRLNEIEVGRRGVSAETAILFAKLTGTSPEFWATLQMRHDIWQALQTLDTSHVKAIA